jgi:hypothetical protein
MDKLTAIKYLLTNGHRSSEWQEAGLLVAVSRTAFSDKETFSQDELDEVIEDARDD